ncbi:hypothetical protein CLM74_06725 [Stenotrophomonas sp. MYb57]|uniref:hypothetical protein n=1 Tax=Stenotrophomonas sp. MYb57 TaxID=1827305 RepID=UPI000CF73F39|nr:hypothetical protein [Stenotrophomonas sp. MYb57]AVJ32488.1 hypothetical protein CLM74_06725 [Stenotrophomonas sp. MYb57]
MSSNALNHRGIARRAFRSSFTLGATIATASLALTSHPALAAESGSEGVAWGATQAQLKEALGERLGTRACPEEQQEEPELKRYARACGSYIEDYTIDGISFVAFFGLRGIEGPLSAVYLDRAATVTNEQIKAGKGAEFRCNRVKKVLAERYGRPERVSETSARPRDKPAVLLTEWVRGDTTITLTETIVSEARGQQYYLSVVYAPKTEVPEGR